jgi:hypothetical protein
MTLAEELRQAGAFGSRTRTTPLWRGPLSTEAQGGLTVSLLTRWLACREKFRLFALEGLAPADDFSHRPEFGTMFHLCEEAVSHGRDWQADLSSYMAALCERYPTRQDQIVHWTEVCRIQFPIYQKHWTSWQGERTGRLKEIAPEQVFRVPYRLGSGRVVLLRGKIDKVLLHLLAPRHLMVMDHKTKGDIDALALNSQLKCDIQTMFYAVALDCFDETRRANAILGPSTSVGRERLPVMGVVYNVIRRPLSGGKYTIQRFKPTKSRPQGETLEEFYARLGGLIASEPEHFFRRWEVGLAPGDVDAFRQTVLDPILEELVDWWEWVTDGDPWRAGNRIHFRHPYGVYNPTNEGVISPYDNALSAGTRVGLHPVTNLFPELS